MTTNGTGFGASQGPGSVQLGSLPANVHTWSDTQIVATVATGSMTGIAHVQQNGVMSHSLLFTVPGSASGVSTLAPNLLNMMVGDTHQLQALDATSHPETGLSWTSSDPMKASVSTDGTATVTALSAGHLAQDANLTDGYPPCDQRRRW